MNKLRTYMYVLLSITLCFLTNSQISLDQIDKVRIPDPTDVELVEKFNPIKSIPDTVFFKSTDTSTTPADSPTATNTPTNTIDVNVDKTVAVEKKLIDISEIIQLNWGKCCNIHYIFSVDVSGSMYYWGSEVQSAITSWQSYLEYQRNWNNYLVSAHQFNHDNLAWPGGEVIRKVPIEWNNPPNSPSGGTVWSHAVEFLTVALTNQNFQEQDDICYTMITDQHPENIYISPSVVYNFWRAQRSWRIHGCQLCVRIIDVRQLPRSKSLSHDNLAERTEFIERPITLHDVFNRIDIRYQYYTPTNLSDFKRYHKCQCRDFGISFDKDP